MQPLVIATKAPWPPADGGRLLLWHTLQGLAGAGVRATLVAPVDPARHDLREVAAALDAVCTPRLVAARPAGAAATAARSALRGLPWTVARHALAAVRREVAALLAARRFDLVHVEQLQALAQAAPALARGLPVLLRAQNVESDLWAGAARHAGGAGPLLRLEARRLATWEGSAVRCTAGTLALSARDAAQLQRLSGGAGKLRLLAAPFPARLEPGATPLAGAPPVVLLEGTGWLPNREGAAWFRRTVWPRVLGEVPGALLHHFGAPRAPAVRGVVPHAAPADSATAFPPGAVLAVPLRVASGVRMKVLEAWARGVPVVGTPEGLAGLEARDGVETLVAADAAGFAAALARLAREPGLAAALVTGGRAALAARHDPERLARELVEIYAALA
jgi:hypothetical protein